MAESGELKVEKQDAAGEEDLKKDAIMKEEEGMATFIWRIQLGKRVESLRMR